MAKEYPYSVAMVKKNGIWRQKLAWLRETFGPEGDVWYAKSHRYYFKHESAVVLYKLRWS